MSEDKDELARRLAAMTESAAEEPHAPSEHAPDQVELGPPAAAPAPGGAPRMILPDTLAPRTAPQPNPFLRPVPPPPSMPAPPSAGRPGSPHEVYYTPPTPGRPMATPQASAPAAAPAAPVDDDAVIVPAPDPTVFAPRAPVRRPVRQHMVQTLGFKRTIIPILLTLGVLCPVLGVLGFFVRSTSPLSVLRSAWFSIPFILIGLLNLGLAIVTMLQVRDELARERREAAGAGAGGVAGGAGVR